MARFSSAFDAHRFAAELERDIRSSIRREIHDRSEDILSTYIGELIEAVCPGCERSEMEVISGGSARCPICGYTDKIRLELNWRE